MRVKEGAMKKGGLKPSSNTPRPDWKPESAKPVHSQIKGIAVACGQYIQMWRLRQQPHSMSQTILSVKAGISVVTLSNVEGGKVVSGLNVYVCLAQAMSISVSDLFRRAEQILSAKRLLKRKDGPHR